MLLLADAGFLLSNKYFCWALSTKPDNLEDNRTSISCILSLRFLSSPPLDLIYATRYWTKPTHWTSSTPGTRQSSTEENVPVSILIFCPILLSLVLDLSKLSRTNSNGFINDNAVINANGHSELDLQAYSTGLTSPNTKSPRLLINTKLPASPESNGLNNNPSPSTGIWFKIVGLAYLAKVPARSPWRIMPSRKSSHRIKLLLV